MASTADIIEAIKADDAGAVRELLAADRTAGGARDEAGLSAVLTATYYGRGEILQALLEAEPELDIFEAAAVGDSARVSELVEASDLVDAWSVDGFTALHLAAFFGHPAVAELLLAAGAEADVPARNPMKVTPLHSASASGRADIARALVERGADVNARQEGGFTPLHAAGQNGDQELAELLLTNGADPTMATNDGKTAADYARESGHGALLELLESTRSK